MTIVLVMATAPWSPPARPYLGPSQLAMVWPLAGPFGALLLAAMAITALH
ncbi:MAG: hypothetical protein JKY37_32485 [Nannocystaceae bacterium]|nr:hypothetical protein [Nannocystaceae bacterium]